MPRSRAYNRTAWYFETSPLVVCQRMGRINKWQQDWVGNCIVERFLTIVVVLDHLRGLSVVCRTVFSSLQQILISKNMMRYMNARSMVRVWWCWIPDNIRRKSSSTFHSWLLEFCAANDNDLVIIAETAGFCTLMSGIWSALSWLIVKTLTC